MSRYTPEQLYSLAKEAYDNSYRIIDEMMDIFNESCRQNVSTAEVISNFDAIVQVCLLAGAFADHQIEVNEVIFIKNIANSIDVLIPINNEIYAQNPSWSYVEWERLPLLDEDEQRRIVSAAVSIIKPYVSSFVDMLAIIDDYSPRDFLKDITKQVSTIAVAFAGIDRDDIDSEQAKIESSLIFSSYKALVIDPWKKTTEKKINFRH